MAFPLPVWLAVQEALLEDEAATDSFDDFDEAGLFEFFHLSRPCVAFIADSVRQRMEATGSTPPLPVDSMIMVALNFYAHGVSSTEVLEKAGLTTGDFLGVVSEVSAVIAGMEEQFISFPTSPKAKAKLAARMEDVCGIPDAVGILGPAHFKVRVMDRCGGNVFSNELGFKSVVSQMVCDLDGNVLSVEKCCVGSSYEQDMWEASCQRKKIEEGLPSPYRLIGASGYHLSKHVLSPVADPHGYNEMCFNKALCKVHDSMRATLVAMKKRFWCLLHLGFVEETKMNKKSNIIKACCVLHNIAMKFSVPVPDLINKVERPYPGKLRSEAADVDPELLRARQELIDTKFCVYVN